MATQRAFYSLQGAGVNYGGVQPETTVKIYRVAVGSVLTYCCSAIYMSQSNMKSLNVIQNNQLKYIVGLRSIRGVSRIFERGSNISWFPKKRWDIKQLRNNLHYICL